MMTIYGTLRTGLFLLGMCALGNGLRAQTTGGDDRLLRTDGTKLIEQALDNDQRTLRTSLADMGETDVREAPSSVMIITARQIQASGARDLQDALRLVPGLSFGRDVDDVIGIGIHGNWAEEGKCLFMLNGMQLNENDFGTYSIGQRIPLDNVERIEVIMGPGAVIHGGYAALGVINIVTRTARNAAGGQAVMQAGHAGGRMARTTTTVSGSTALNADQEVNYLASLYRGNRSNVTTLLPDSTPISFGDSTAGQTASFQFGYRWRTLKAHVYYMDEGYEVSDGGYQTRMRDMIIGLEQRKQLGAKHQFGWKVTHDDQIPWYYVNTPDPERIASNTSNVRTSTSAYLILKATPWLSFRMGGQGYRQRSMFFSRQGVEFAMNNQRGITMTGISAFAEVEAKGRLGNLSGGYRMEYNNLSGDYYAPRASYAKVLGRFHGKVLASRAFKIPSIMNLNYGPEKGTIATEYANTSEVEFGFRPGKRAQFTTNLYRTSIENPIVYVFDAATLDNYINRSRSGTEGFDLRFQLEHEELSIYLGFGLYRTLTNSDLPEAELPSGIGRSYQALPNQRATATIAKNIGQCITLRTRAQWRSTVWSYQFVDTDQENLELMEWGPELAVDAGIAFRPSAMAKWNVDLGVYNLLDTDRHILGPYSNGSIPLIQNGREFAVKATYRFAQQ